MKRHGDETPTASRILGDTIVELVYDATQQKTALVVARNGRWTIVDEHRARDGAQLVPYAASNNLIRHACVMLASKPVPSGEKRKLLQDIEAYLHRFVDLSPLFERLAAHYVLLTWVYDAFNELPYLRFKGDFGSGKTRALLAIGSIAYKGFFASGASTVSPIFHTLDRFAGTLILDEADLRLSDKTADIVKILNNGTVKGLPVLRSVRSRTKEFNPAAFHVFGPKIVAMRGTFKDQALESRFLTETMGQRPLRSDIPIALPDALASEALGLRNRLLHFRLMQLFAIKSDAGRLVAGIDPRLNQTALSLASLIDDGMLLQEFEAMMRVRHRDLIASRSRNLPEQTLAALAQALRETPRSTVPIGEIADRVNDAAGGQGPWISPRAVGQALRQKSLRLRKSHGRIVVAVPGVGGPAR